MDRLSGEALDAVLLAFLSEDVGSLDVTTEYTVPAGTRTQGELVAKSECVVSGLPVARRVFELLDPDLAWEEAVSAGMRVAAPTPLAYLSGRARALLTAERVALNVLQRMCGIATATRRFVEAVAGTPCRILDTRKTAPGLRPFDRQAVRDGGGVNHRYDLTEMVLIKDNHRRLSGGVARAVAAARAGAPDTPVEVEVESEAELAEAIASGADRILIDNQPPETVARWCGLARAAARPPFVEASGNMRLETVRAYALAGVDAVSVGALTHSVAAADVSLELFIA
ncbi:MAG TPA: carboxylating nicotinate-nucleotide diphosphorylase [Thermoanaerobaculia bacterium]|jgi:nicotinate-nucleotide pyrophosphorylase (carboxylating)|nr:carboxylating nicotinate-nucleotide diphosphorylase [Thermoanaerobaculia bacterium]